jgi:hypothetical protein
MRFAAALLLGCLVAPALPVHADSYYVTVAGLGGEPDYEQRFEELAKNLDALFKASGSTAHVFTLSGPDATKAKLTDTLTQISHQAKPDDDFVLTMIGHGTFDSVEYKFNLVGPDISATDLAALCDRIPAKRQLIVNTTSSSGGSAAAFKKPGRAVITATKSGTEKNATVFARYWVAGLGDEATDTDKNEAISALEAFRYADRKTAEFYEAQKRLATEHPQFEDTGKSDPVRAPSTDSGEGLLLSSFTLVRLGEAQRASEDPAKRELLARREELERTVDTLKYQKAAMSEDDYKRQLTAALLELAKVQQELDK